MKYREMFYMVCKKWLGSRKFLLNTDKASRFENLSKAGTLFKMIYSFSGSEERKPKSPFFLSPGCEEKTFRTSIVFAKSEGRFSSATRYFH